MASPARSGLKRYELHHEVFQHGVGMASTARWRVGNNLEVESGV